VPATSARGDFARVAAYAGSQMTDRDKTQPSAEGGRAEGESGAPGLSLAPEPMQEAEVQAQLDDIDVDAPRVGILMGSKSDMEAMEKAAKELEERGILHEVRVMSAHREPDAVSDYAKNAHMRGLRVIIAGAGISAALPGAVAAHTDLPVIGVPLSGRLSAAGGLDAILSIVQMPPGVPVACVGLDNARNAAVLAAQILGA
jgi:5-(carboxyamino)imidazole ribonucleotide mutase